MTPVSADCSVHLSAERSPTATGGGRRRGASTILGGRVAALAEDERYRGAGDVHLDELLVDYHAIVLF